MNIKYTRICPECNCNITVGYKAFWYGNKHNSLCRSCSVKGNKGNTIGSMSGKKHSIISKQKMSLSAKNDRILRNSDEEFLKNLSDAVKIAMHKPEIRKKHIEGIKNSKWIKVKTDNGQLELLEKWNRLGFQFEPNYQVHTDIDLFYIDGYDKKHNVVIEYDSKYHKKSYQKNKDLSRQQKIIDILKPNKFFRYDAVNKTIENVLGENK